MDADSLFITTVEQDELDLAFVHIRDDPACADDRAYLEGAWAFYRPLADRHFHDQLQRQGQFQGRAWELRLAWTIHALGLVVTTRRPAGPDLTVSSARDIHFEAVAPQPTGKLLENDRRARSGFAPVPESDMILRATSAIRDKRAQYRRHVESGAVRSDEPFVIAISGANISQATITKGVHWILKPLFAVGEFYVTVEIDRDGPGEKGYIPTPERRSSRGAPVDSALFMDNRASEVSAVLFSPHHIKNRPESVGRPPGSDFLIIHNPFAKNPLPRSLLACGREYDARGDELVLLNDWRPEHAEASPA